jgi:hypothetical protein
MRAYKAGWMHYAAWCDERGFVVIPATPTVVRAYFGSLADSHAPSAIGTEGGFSFQPLVSNQPFQENFHNLKKPLCSRAEAKQWR